MLVLHDIGMNYGERVLFEHLSLQCDKGIVALYGPSGVGKTTLLHIAGSLGFPTTGTVLRNNISLYDQSRQYRQQFRNQITGFAFQDFQLLDDFTVVENLHLPFRIGSGSLQQDKKWTDSLIERFDIGRLLDQKVRSLSGGEKERTSIVKAVIHQPSVLFLDEPGSSLHQTMRYEMYDFILTYAQNHIVMIASHDEEMKKIVSLEKKQEFGEITVFGK